MILALTLSLVAAAPAAPRSSTAVRADDPPIHVWLNSDNSFFSGDRARVHIRAAQDGYVVVLRADGDGHVRVLFPLDPSADAFVRGGDKREIRSRGGREAFIADEREGAGLVLAAWSKSAFKFDQFVRADHWDYSALDSHESSSADREAALVDLVQAMAGENHFDYDVVTYTVTSVQAYYRRPYWGPGYYPGWGWRGWGGWGGWGWWGRPHRFGVGLGIGFGYCDPFWGCGAYSDPFFYDAFLYDPFFYGGYYYRPYVYRPFAPFVYGGVRTRSPFYGTYGGLLYTRARPGGTFTTGFGTRGRTWLSAAPTLRLPAGSLTARSTGTAVRARSTGTSWATAASRGRSADFATRSFQPSTRSTSTGSRVSVDPSTRSTSTGSRVSVDRSGPSSSSRDSWSGRVNSGGRSAPSYSGGSRSSGGSGWSGAGRSSGGGRSGGWSGGGGGGRSGGGGGGGRAGGGGGGGRRH